MQVCIWHAAVLLEYIAFSHYPINTTKSINFKIADLPDAAIRTYLTLS